MKITRKQLRRLIKEATDSEKVNQKIAKTKEILQTKMETNNLKQAKVIFMDILSLEGQDIDASLLNAQQPIIEDKFAEVLGVKRVVKLRMLKSFFKKRGMSLEDFSIEAHEKDKFHDEIANELNVHVVSVRYGKSPGYKKDKLMRYGIDIYDPAGDLSGSDSTVDVSSDRKSHQQIKDGVTKVCKQAGLI